MDTEAIINSLQTAPQFAALKKEVVDITPRKILVMEQCGLTEARRGRIETETNSKSVGGGDDFLLPAERFGLSRLYVDMASVSFGDVPTFIEFAAMRPADIGVWQSVAERVNPSMFAWIKELAKAIEQADAEMIKAAQEEADKKK